MAWINFFGDKVRIKDIFLRNGKCLADVFYPVGSIYISAASTNPADMFGGTWEAISGRFLLGAGKNAANTTNYWGSTSAKEVDFSAGEMGGEYYHTLTFNEVIQYNMWTSHTGYNPGIKTSFDNGSIYGINTWNNTKTKQHNNMPPYVSVYMWQRTA